MQLVALSITLLASASAESRCSGPGLGCTPVLQPRCTYSSRCTNESDDGLRMIESTYRCIPQCVDGCTTTILPADATYSCDYQDFKKPSVCRCANTKECKNSDERYKQCSGLDTEASCAASSASCYWWLGGESSRGVTPPPTPPLLADTDVFVEVRLNGYTTETFDEQAKAQWIESLIKKGIAQADDFGRCERSDGNGFYDCDIPLNESAIELAIADDHLPDQESCNDDAWEKYGQVGNWTKYGAKGICQDGVMVTAKITFPTKISADKIVKKIRNRESQTDSFLGEFLPRLFYSFKELQQSIRMEDRSWTDPVFMQLPVGAGISEFNVSYESAAFPTVIEQQLADTATVIEQLADTEIFVKFQMNGYTTETFDEQAKAQLIKSLSEELPGVDEEAIELAIAAVLAAKATRKLQPAVTEDGIMVTATITYPTKTAADKAIDYVSGSEDDFVAELFLKFKENIVKAGGQVPAGAGISELKASGESTTTFSAASTEKITMAASVLAAFALVVVSVF